jgi:hypothetical protein
LRKIFVDNQNYHLRHSCPAKDKFHRNPVFMARSWIPAFAGMTHKRAFLKFQILRKRSKRFTDSSLDFLLA